MSHHDNAEAWAYQQDMLERERQAIEALNRCLAAGAKVDDIKTLARECGIDIKHLTINTGKANAAH